MNLFLLISLQAQAAQNVASLGLDVDPVWSFVVVFFSFDDVYT